ncbi:MAG: bifunctional diguanylate cyclase/phosphodiesterase [Bacillota bacterium]|nr:bifunctional diguanylate cyclase/phosphodiesterase [Bacillota bacterium]
MSMNRDRKLRTILLIYLVIPFAVTTLFLILGIFTVTRTIRGIYYQQATSQAHQLIRGYALGMAKTIDAERIINELLDEKLLIAGETTAQHARITASEQLTELAVQLQVDEISLYDEKGVVVFSSVPQMLGWQAGKHHPAMLLLNEGSGHIIKPYSSNTVTGSVCKCAYFLTPNGFVVQIGCHIDNILPILDDFSIDRMIHEILADQAILKVSFIDNSFTVIASTDEGDIGNSPEDAAVLDAISREESIGMAVRLGSIPAYETYMPVHLGDGNEGTLMICQSLSGMDQVIRTCSLIVIGVMLIAYISVYLTVMLSHQKNKRRVERAYIDDLTGLPNTVDLYESIAACQARINQQQAAILLVGFKDFTSINLKLGYSLGDQVIRRAAQTIRSIESAQSRVFRFNTEKFAVLVTDQPLFGLEVMARTIQALFEKPASVAQIKHQLIAQTGIYPLTDAQEAPEQVLRHAAIALTYARNDPNIACAFYSEAMEAALYREEAIEKELIEIINDPDPERFYLNFQPLVDLTTNKIIGFEALARLCSPQFGAVSPQEFIKIAEDRNLIISLGAHILRLACSFLQSLRQAGYGGVKVAVNISIIQLLDAGFIETVQQIIRETGVEAADLEMEITESVIADNFNEINDVLKILRSLGIHAALDDFGKGYSSFIRLSELHVAILKIDRYFINMISIDGHNDSITGSIIDMAHQIGLRVVAEGVEQLIQRDFLKDSGCDIMQGYLISKPLPEQKARALLTSTT